ncbi:MAG: DUF5615 family PIN-like protein [Limisphaerales bacterium]
MLRLLTDEQISPAVARQASARCPGLQLESIQVWEGGHFLGASDEVVLQEAHRRQLTLVTFDLRTIPPLLRQWAEQGIDHSGVILVDEQTLAQNDVGGLIAALGAVWKVHRDLDWTNRVVYLRSSG